MLPLNTLALPTVFAVVPPVDEAKLAVTDLFESITIVAGLAVPVRAPDQPVNV